MTASALIAMVGGFRRSAYGKTADFATYDIENSTKVQLMRRLSNWKWLARKQDCGR